MEEEKPKPTKTKTDDKKEDSKEIDESELVFSDVGFVILLEWKGQTPEGEDRQIGWTTFKLWSYSWAESIRPSIIRSKKRYNFNDFNPKTVEIHQPPLWQHYRILQQSVWASWFQTESCWFYRSSLYDNGRGGEKGLFKLSSSRDTQRYIILGILIHSLSLWRHLTRISRQTKGGK